MKCPSCAANYDDKFSFCPYCGTSKPQPPTVRLQVEQPVPVHVVQEPRYEYMSIEGERVSGGGFFTNGTRKVVARGTGRNQDTVYAESPVFKEDDYKKEREYWDALRRRFFQEGWDEAPENGRKLRRRVA